VVHEVGRSVFVIPPEAFKSKRAHVVVLNDAAWSIVQTPRGKDPTWVFPYLGKRVSTMNNTAWQRVRQEVDLRSVRIHDLRHAFACRLRAAGVSAEDREALLGHAQPYDGRPLRQRRCWPFDQASESRAKPRRHMQCPAHRERTRATAVDKRSG
jgi:integrase